MMIRMLWKYLELTIFRMEMYASFSTYMFWYQKKLAFLRSVFFTKLKLHRFKSVFLGNEKKYISARDNQSQVSFLKEFIALTSLY